MIALPTVTTGGRAIELEGIGDAIRLPTLRLCRKGVWLRLSGYYYFSIRYSGLPGSTDVDPPLLLFQYYPGVTTDSEMSTWE